MPRRLTELRLSGSRCGVVMHVLRVMLKGKPRIEQPEASSPPLLFEKGERDSPTRQELCPTTTLYLLGTPSYLVRLA